MTRRIRIFALILAVMSLTLCLPSAAFATDTYTRDEVTALLEADTIDADVLHAIGGTASPPIQTRATYSCSAYLSSSYYTAAFYGPTTNSSYTSGYLGFSSSTGPTSIRIYIYEKSSNATVYTKLLEQTVGLGDYTAVFKLTKGYTLYVVAMFEGGNSGNVGGSLYVN